MGSNGAAESFWDDNKTTVITGVVIVALLAGLVGVRAVVGGSDSGVAVDGAVASSDNAPTGPTGGDSPVDGEAGSSGTAVPANQPEAGSAEQAQAGTTPAQADAPASQPSEATQAAGPTAPPPPPVSTGTLLPGVTQEEITLVYYWKGDRTRTSPYLNGTGTEGNVDEAEAFRKLVDYINKYADGGATIMGYEFNLHGRRINPIVLEAGQDAESYAATAQTIVQEVKPFAAVAAHGSISAYLCPVLADAGIHNFATYDLGGALAARTDGYCTPGSISWDRQVDLSKGWLLKQQASAPYVGPEAIAGADRVYGVIYTEYPGLIDSAPKMIEAYKAAGLNIAQTATLNSSLATAQQQAPNIVAQMRAAGVNTIIMPDAGAPLNFTHAAQTQGYGPDYFIWPCSGQDTEGMVRLFNDGQWQRAEGLTCYDAEFVSDLTHNEKTRATEWYRAWTEMGPAGAEPPAPTPFVYAGLLPVLAGITAAGPELNLENFRAGLDSFTPYRYDAVDGRTDDGSNMLLTVGTDDRSFMSDVMYLKYDATKQTSGNATPGAYVFPDPKRYQRGSDF